MTDQLQVGKAVGILLKEVKFNAKALLATIYGDMLLPHGGLVWLGSLVEICKPFHISETLARTSALRLVYDGWLASARIGKLSYYSMTPENEQRVHDYYPRVYGVPPKQWDGQWQLFYTAVAAAGGVDTKKMLEALRWQGLSQLPPPMS